MCIRDRRATLDGLPNTKVIRDLRKANEEQTKRIDELLAVNNDLIERIGKLETGDKQ